MAVKSTSEWASSGVPGKGSCVEIKPGIMASLEEGGATLPLLSLSQEQRG